VYSKTEKVKTRNSSVISSLDASDRSYFLGRFSRKEKKQTQNNTASDISSLDASDRSYFLGGFSRKEKEKKPPNNGTGSDISSLHSSDVSFIDGVYSRKAQKDKFECAQGTQQILEDSSVYSVTSSDDSYLENSDSSASSDVSEA